MKVQEVPPENLEIDPLNERNENVGPHKDDDSLEESIQEQGLIQPPVARSDNGQLKVIVGQRRTLAAQSAGLEKIPVIIVEWDDEEALQATITENVDAFTKKVSKSDRAAAIEDLREITGWSIQRISDELGVNRRTLSTWLERTRSDWEETSVHVDSRNESTNESEEEVVSHPSNSVELSKEDLEQVPDTDLQTIRNATESPDERESAVETVVKNELSTRDIREARTRSEHEDDSLDKQLKEISKEKSETEGDIKVRTEVTFSGDYAVGLQQAARDQQTSEEQVIRGAIEEYLTEEGYLENGH